MIALKACLAALVFSASALRAGIVVSFPAEPPSVVKDHSKLFSGLTQGDVSRERKPVHIEGVLAYWSTPLGLGSADRNVEIESFSQIREGMTFREMVSLFGPGVQDSLSGIGMICWGCKDGRVLMVNPGNAMNDKASYRITLRGLDQRHKDVEELAKKLIASIEIFGGAVKIALTEDTHQAKAHEVAIYQEGETFQKTDPLPRIDFTIMKIEGKSVICQYYYVVPPEGCFHYSESGSIILSQAGGGSSDRPDIEMDSKGEDGGKSKPQPSR